MENSFVTWENSVAQNLNDSVLDALFEQKIAGLLLPSFLTDKLCDQLRDHLQALVEEHYANVYPPIARAGVTVFEYDEIGKATYFSHARREERRIREALKEMQYPLQMVLGWINSSIQSARVDVAEEDGFGPYFAGLIRRIESGTLIHVDYAPHEHPSWSVASVERQLAFNLYLDIPQGEPGLVTVWEKPWQREDTRFKQKDSYGYSPEVVNGVPCAVMRPQKGAVMLINTQLFHQVAPSSGTRLAVSGAIGRKRDGSLIAWS